jgi:hypothetical protein
MNIYDHIYKRIEKLKIVAEENAKDFKQHLNILVFIGHGIING